jgi:hypothetical protein
MRLRMSPDSKGPDFGSFDDFAPLDHADLVVEPLDEAERDLVLQPATVGIAFLSTTVPDANMQANG